MSSLKHLSITNCDLGVLKADVFQGLGQLDTLALDYCTIDDIDHSFKHLKNLTELSLAYCKGIGIGLKDGPQVGRILHAKPARHKFEREQEQNSHNWDKSCTHTCHFHKPFLGISRLSPYKLRGPTSLNALDLTNVLVFPDDAEDAANEDDPAPPLLGENATQLLPLADLKFLNLTGALLNMDSPMEHLAFDLMPSLQVSHQTITMWNFTIMRENSTD